MAAGKVVGQIQVTQGIIKVIGADGVVREPRYGGFMYENEQIISNDPMALFQIKFLALPEASAYDGIFRILADGTALHGRDAMESVSSDESLLKALETAGVEDTKAADEDVEDLETAAGEEGADGSSAYIPTDIVAESSVQGFGRGPNAAVPGLGGVSVDEDMIGNPTEAQTEDPNNSPEAMAENITKIADYIESEARNTDVSVAALTFPKSEATLVSNIEHNGLTYYGVRDNEQGNPDHDSGNPLVDNHGEITEGVSFSFDEIMSSATLSFWNANDIINGNDNVRIDLYLGDDPVPVGTINAADLITEHVGGEIVFRIDIDVNFDEIQVIAIETVGNQPTEFRVAFVESYTVEPTHTLLPFVIDDDMLLANDADIDGPDDALQIELVDGNLYHTDTGDIIGSVSIIGDSGSEDYGSVLVTPSAGVFFDTHDPAFANFTYVVVDEDGGRSEPVSATIDVAVGTLLDAAANPIGYDPSTSDGIDDYFMIGTDENDADAFDNNILIINEGTLDLSHISDINTIELGPDATVLGSSELGYINPSDVIGATDVNHVLVIHSAGSDDASSQVDVHESFGEASEYEGGSTPSLGVEGVYYNQYIADGATLLIEIEPPIEVE